MLKPPAMPASVLLAGKLSVAAGWVIGLSAMLLTDAASSWHTIGICLTAFLAGSHAVELLVYRAFLAAARASAADYVQVFLFGVFHSGGMKTDSQIETG